MAAKEKVGGRAYSNGIRLMNGNYSVKAYYDKNNNLHYKKRGIKRSKYHRFFDRIPVLRGIISIIFALKMFLKESFNHPKKYWVIILIILADIIFFLLPASTPGSTRVIINLVYYSLPIILIIIFKDVIIEVLKYHGAEHKAVNYYENDCEGEIDSYSRLHRRCGSNLVFYYLIISLIMLFINIPLNSFLLEIIYIGLAYEVIRYTPEKLLFLPFLFQRIVTREPDTRHLKAARLALDKLQNFPR